MVPQHTQQETLPGAAIPTRSIHRRHSIRRRCSTPWRPRSTTLRRSSHKQDQRSGCIPQRINTSSPCNNNSSSSNNSTTSICHIMLLRPMAVHPGDLRSSLSSTSRLPNTIEASVPSQFIKTFLLLRSSRSPPLLCEHIPIEGNLKVHNIVLEALARRC